MFRTWWFVGTLKILRFDEDGCCSEVGRAGLVTVVALVQTYLLITNHAKKKIELLKLMRAILWSSKFIETRSERFVNIIKELELLLESLFLQKTFKVV